MIKISCIQLKSNDDLKNNLNKTKKLIKKAVSQKSDFILTPEVSSMISLKRKELEKKASKMEDDLYCTGIKHLAQKYKKWILIGSAIVKNKKNKIVNRSILIDPNGVIKKYYDKIHLFNVKLSSNEKYYESKTFHSGKRIKTFKLPWGKLGFSICYDLRFPSMYREMSKKGCIFLSIPSAFTKTTGKKHWHALLRARAIENFCYVFAPAQGGKHYDGRKTFGHSLIISPDGQILKEIKNDKEGVITANINIKLPEKLRSVIPSLINN